MTTDPGFTRMALSTWPRFSASAAAQGLDVASLTARSPTEPLDVILSGIAGLTEQEGVDLFLVVIGEFFNPDEPLASALAKRAGARGSLGGVGGDPVGQVIAHGRRGSGVKDVYWGLSSLSTPTQVVAALSFSLSRPAVIVNASDVDVTAWCHSVLDHLGDGHDWIDSLFVAAVERLEEGIVIMRASERFDHRAGVDLVGRPTSLSELLSLLSSFRVACQD